MINIWANNNFTSQIDNLYHPTPISMRITHFYTLVGGKGVFLFFGIPILFLTIHAIKNTKHLKNITCILMLGLVLISTGVIISGFAFDLHGLRYLAIYFPVLVFVLVKSLPTSVFKFFINPLFSVTIILIIFCSFYIKHDQLKKTLFLAAFQRILNCDEFQPESKGTLVFAL